jgi:hypothetical protein
VHHCSVDSTGVREKASHGDDHWILWRMIHTISVVNLDGVVALCQHYDRSTPEEQAEWEEVLANVIFVEDGGLVRETCQRSDVVRVLG